MEKQSPQELPSETTVAGIFETDFEFAIPPYQRAYSWGKKQLTQFLQDLKEQPDGKPYFLGHFLFERDDGGEAVSRQLFVIDGQQRLTTVIIFFSCLIREIERRGKPAAEGAEDISLSPDSLRARYLQRPDGNRLHTVPYDRAFFNRCIVEGQEENIDEDAPRSQKLIQAAREIFANELEPISIATLSRWQKTIGTAVITTFEVKKKVQATQIFTFQNDRGIKPTDLEILKAFLMHKVYLHSANLREEDAIRDIEDYFSNIYKLIEVINLGEDQVLGYHSAAFLQGSGSALENVRAELKVVEMDAKVKWITEFCHGLLESFRHTAEIEGRAEREYAFADVLILDAPNSWPLLLKLFRFHKREIGGAIIQRILRLMEITLFKMRYSTGDYRSNHFPAFAKSYDGKDADALKNKLEWHAQNGFQGYWAFNDLFKAYLNGYHHYTATTRYLLWKHENKLRNRNNNPSIPPVEYQNKYGEPKWNSTIDHVMPQTPSDGSVHPPLYQERYLHNLGNLVLMNLSKNASANNDLPMDKVKTLSDSPLSSHRNVAETIRRTGQWKEAEIDARKQEIIGFALGYWEA